MRFTKSSSFYSIPVFEFNLPAGHSCPYALACKTLADRDSGKLSWDKENRVFRCYAASAERFPSVRKSRWNNFQELLGKSTQKMAESILSVFPKDDSHIRIHGSGDFFCQDYFDAWILVCQSKPKATLWAFTKSIRYWVSRLDKIPQNLTLQASYGSKEDFLIKKHGLKFAKWFPSKKEARASQLPIDTDDSLAMKGAQSFGLVDNFAE